MDVQAVLSTMAVFLVTAGSEQNTTSNMSNLTETPSTSSLATANPSKGVQLMGLLKVKWMSGCRGDIELLLYQQTPPLLVCHSSKGYVTVFLEAVCQERPGCKRELSWHKGRNTSCYDIQDSGVQKLDRRGTLRVHCSAEEAEADLQGQLRAYKVVTALLCCGLLLLLMIRFTKPTVKALQKRLSDRRQNRWIGPTQSHSVSYHREQNTVKADKEKRVSYPALERLAVFDSREPSSNRNSDCNY